MRAEPILYSDDWSLPRRVAALAALRLRVAGPGTVHALYPRRSNPVITYPLRTAAATYAHTHLLPQPASGAHGVVHRALASVIGCAPSVAAVVVAPNDGGDLALPPDFYRLLPETKRRVVESVLAIQTTRRVWLLFGRDGTRPELVVRPGDRGELEREFAARRALYALDPTLLPEPIACGAWTADRWAAVDAGVAGLPWFRQTREFRTPRWKPLLDRLLETLARLHRAIRSRDGWCRPVVIAGELRRQVDACAAAGVRLSAATAARLAELAERARAVAPVNWFAQHGDFCPNNVIVARDRVTVIDFEEFDATAVPLHDELGLAFSVDSFMDGAPDRPSLDELVWLCTGPTVERSPDLAPLVPMLVAHHLLWRAAESTGRPGREALVASLERRIAEFASNAGAFGAAA